MREMKHYKHYTNEFISYCKTNRNLSDLTLRAYALDLSQFTRYLDEKFCDPEDYKTITKGVLDDYVCYLSTKYKVKTIKRHMACLRSYFNYLEYTEKISVNPFDKFRLNIKEGFHIPVSLELNEVEEILQAVYKEQRLWESEKNHIQTTGSNYFIYSRDVAILELLFASGLRVSELCSITNQQMCEDLTSITITGKGDKERELYIGHAQVLNALKEYARLRAETGVESTAFFVTKFGKPLSTQAVRNLVTKYAEQAGIHKNVTPHAFRHSFASLLLDADVNIKYIQEFLGHSSIATTQLYLHTSNSKKRSILSTMHPRQKMGV